MNSASAFFILSMKTAIDSVMLENTLSGESPDFLESNSHEWVKPLFSNMESLIVPSVFDSDNASFKTRAIERGLKSTPKGFVASHWQRRIRWAMLSAKQEPVNTTGFAGFKVNPARCGIYSVRNFINQMCLARLQSLKQSSAQRVILF